MTCIGATPKARRLWLLAKSFARCKTLSLIHIYDYRKYLTGVDEKHAEESADAVMPILAKTGLFSVCEIRCV